MARSPRDGHGFRDAGAGRPARQPRRGGAAGGSPGAPLLSLRRLRRLDRLAVAFAVDHSLVPAQLQPGAGDIDFATGSLYAALRACGVRPVRSYYEVQAEAATSEVAGLLGVDAGFPVLAARQVAHDAAGRHIERGHITYRGDRYRFRAVLRG